MTRSTLPPPWRAFARGGPAVLPMAAFLAVVAIGLPARADDAPSTAGAGNAATDAAAAQISERVEAAVVKIFATTRRPDLNHPWTRQSPAEITGSGVVIEGHRILTNAHVVAYAGQLQVQADREGDKYGAKVAAVAPGMDLAVLTLDDDSFFERHAPLERSASLPQIKDAVLAYGFPVGGNSLSITKGIVSRIEFAAYNANTAGLRVQIDAAINPGNSGGPATAGDRMIGLAFSSLGGTQNIAYIIPNEEIELFLSDLADGHYDGKPLLHDDLQTLENPALRGFLKLDPSVHGIIVHRPSRHEADYPLREWDVITAIGGVAVDDQGMILANGNLRVALQYQIQHSARDGRIGLSIVRDGKKQSIEVPLQVERPALVKSLDGLYPSYFIYGPVVFSRATVDLMSALRGAGASPTASWSLMTQMLDAPTPERDELVVIPAPLFPHAISKGYGNVANAVVSSINGVTVRNLRHLVTLLRNLKDEFVVIGIEGKREGENLIFRRSEMLAATEEILSDNGVREQGSADMMAVWNGKEGS
ncbi:MAG TPA: trypsin-like peptidase domain-containing protein [Candidatus Polarisedimenticolaceae bacterium]|nr:trypsin-like peptidase domain-containing protein [Candidatus Polarisedimenticolaceae bacterium]